MGCQLKTACPGRWREHCRESLTSDGKPVKFEVINAAAGGYSPYNYWKAYHRWAPVFNPDVVLVGLSPDDYDCNNENAHYLIEDGETLAVLQGWAGAGERWKFP